MKTILLIEDYADSARLVIRALKRHDYRLLHASDGETGLQMAAEYKPDLILLDLGLPDVDGQTLLGWIRRVPEMAHVPVVAVTAWPDDVAAQMVEAYGFDGYITKPISVATFGDQVAAYLSSVTV